MICVDVARNPGSALRVFASSDRLANHFKIIDIGEVGKLVTKIEMDAPTMGKLVKKSDMSDESKVGEVGIDMGDTKIENR